MVVRKDALINDILNMDINQRPWMEPIPIGDNNQLMLPSRGLKLIGIRFYPCFDESREIIKMAMNIQKNLYGHDWLYFNKGFRIVETEMKDRGIPRISHIEVDESAFDSSFLLYSNPLEVNIGFSAIIGQNGTGKSTIVDTIIRLINNLSAAIIGEDYVYSSAQHLHYIEHVYASLAVYIDSQIKILTCLGKKLFITPYEANLLHLNQAYKNVNTRGSLVERYNPGVITDILYGNEPVEEILPPQNGLRKILKDWFYTLVGNYSLYAYNYRDFYSERTSETKLAKLRTIRPEDNKLEDEFWLKGVFHKNDGYQTPVVIHPMRDEGYVNAAKVNYLGKQNLISLAFVKNKSSNEFPFRIINKTHHLVAFYFYPLETKNYKGAIEGIMSEKLDIDEQQKNLFRFLEEPIKRFWADAIGIPYNYNGNGTTEQRAWDYLVYKTIKIFWNYKHYENAWKSLNGSNAKNELNSHLEELIKDSSHRTLKLRQVLSYLRFNNDNDYYLNKGPVVDLDSIYSWMSTKINIQLYPGKDFHPISVEDLLPPPYPIIDVALQLVDNEHFNEYQQLKNSSMNIIPFEGLSSGERQIAYTLGNIIYHLKNIESAMADYNRDPNHLHSLKYNHVNIMLDEVELYFHPDLQRRFVCLLLEAIKGLNFKGICGINVTLVTHSPFVLSDIPAENILSLSRSKDEILDGNTFAANIHDLFNNTFILPYTIGELAKKEIEHIIFFYNSWKDFMRKGKFKLKFSEPWNDITKRDWTRMKYIANIIGDDYLHDEVTDMLDEIEEETNEEN